MMKLHSAVAVCSALVCVIGLPGSPCRGADSSAARKLEPWWKQKKPVEVIAEKRREKINPENWPEAEVRHRTLHVVGYNERFKGYGRVKILDFFAKADVFHFTENEREFEAGFYLTYEIEEPANVILKTNSGSAFWSFRNWDKAFTTVFYTGENWDLTQKGIFAQEVPVVTWRSYIGSFGKGVHEFAGHRLFQMYDPETKNHIDWCNAHKRGSKYGRLALGTVKSIVDDTRFTLANLREYRMSIDEVVSDWRNEGYVGVTLNIVDVDGDRYAVPGAEVEARVIGAGRHESNVIALEPTREFHPRGCHWGFRGRIPGEFYEPETIEIAASVRVLGPDRILRTEELKKIVAKEESTVTPADKWLETPPRKELRTKDGKLIETRFLTSHEGLLNDRDHSKRKLKHPDKAKWILDAAKKTNANALILCVQNSGWSFVASEILHPKTNLFPKGLDILKDIIEGAHGSGIEVHAWICFSRGGWEPPVQGQVLKLHPEWAMRDIEGKPNHKWADVHRPGYRALMLEFVLDLARRYDIDGINLDYIRTGVRCYCEECRKEYREKTGRDLVKDAKAGPFPLPFIEWQEGAVNAFVRSVREGLNEVRPGIKVTAFVGYPPSMRMHSLQGSNGALWLNKGWVDALLPMLYVSSPEGLVFGWQDYALRVNRPDRVWPTVWLWRPAERMVPLYKAALDKCHVRGYGIFDLDFATDEHVNSLAENTNMFAEPAVPHWGEPAGE